MQRYNDDFTPNKKPDETGKLTDEITENVDKWNGKTTKNQRKKTLKHCRKCGIVRANGSDKEIRVTKVGN